MAADLRAASTASDRRFVALPPARPALESPRRIWEVEPAAVLVALGVLLERHELEAVLRDLDCEDPEGGREDVVLRDAVRRCGMPCPFAETIERLLDARTRRVRCRVGGSPMSELATWWLSAREVAGGQQLTALLWSLARDRRWVVRPLLDRVQADLWVRALRLLGEPRLAD